MMNAITATTATLSRHERGHANGSATAKAASSIRLAGFKATLRGDKLAPSTINGRARKSPLPINGRLIMLAVLFITGVASGDSSTRMFNNLGALQQLGPQAYGGYSLLDYSSPQSLSDELSTNTNYVICTKDLCQQILAPSGYSNLDSMAQLAMRLPYNSDIIRGPPSSSSLDYLELVKKANSPKHTPRFGRRRR